MNPVTKPSRTYSPGVWAALGFLACSILAGLADIVFLLRHYTRFPFGDQWAWLEKLYKYGLWATLGTQFNEHRLVIPGLCYFADHRYFGGTNTFLVLLLVGMQIGCILLLILPIGWQAGIPKPVRYIFGGFVVITMLWFIQAEDFFYPYQICIICCNLGILGALHLFARCVERTRQSQTVFWLGIGVVGCAFWANFSNGHGILVWPVLLAMGVVLRLPARPLVIGGMVMLGALAIYFFHYHTPAQHAGPWESLQHPIQVMHYAALMIGLPFFGAGTQDIGLSRHAAAYVISLAGILCALVMLTRFALFKALQNSREQIIYSSLMLLCLGTCAITALGRSRFPVWQALSGRYAPIAMLFWISLAGLATACLCGREAGGGTRRAIWCGVMIVASSATLATQARMGRYMAGREREQAAAALSITLGVPDMARIGEELSRRFDRIEFVDRAARPFLGHSLFWRAGTEFLGTPLPDHFQLLGADDCAGFVDASRRLPEPTMGARLLGWAWDRRPRGTVSGIWVVDDQKVIRGMGVTRVSRPDVGATFVDHAMDAAGWIAYAQLPAQGPDALTVFASLDDNQRSVCQIGAPRAPQNQ